MLSYNRVRFDGTLFCNEIVNLRKRKLARNFVAMSQGLRIYLFYSN
jgi:hypothetical protein